MRATTIGAAGRAPSNVSPNTSLLPDLNAESNTMEQHPIVSQEEWLAARTEFLRKEKEFTRLRDRLSAERRALPWVKVEKNYVFDGPGGKETLADLFGGRS